MKRISLLVLALTVNGLIGTVLADGVIRKFSVRTVPTFPNATSKFRTYYACYSLYDGRHLRCKIDHRILGPKQPQSVPANSGGHVNHNINRPRSNKQKPLNTIGVDYDPDPFVVVGYTVSGSQYTGVVLHEMPESSGTLLGESLMVLPPRWYCVWGCYTYNSWKWEDTYKVHVTGLTANPLAQSGAHHVVVRGDIAQHPTGTHAQPDVAESILKIAKDYYDLGGFKLSINDISLPYGGKFDTKFTFYQSGGHRTHRRGRDADINQVDGSGIKTPCSENRILSIVVRQNANGGSRPLLKCESSKTGLPDPDGPFAHIDF